MTITIPEWLLWLVGIPAAIALVGLALIGAVRLWVFKDGGYPG